MDNNNNNPRDSFFSSLNKKTETKYDMDEKYAFLEIKYDNYIRFSIVLNNDKKILQLRKRNLQLLREQIKNYNELIELLQPESSSTEIKDNDGKIDKAKEEKKKVEDKMKETEEAIEILEIQIEALESTVNKVKEILLKVGVELPDISEIEKQLGEEPVDQEPVGEEHD